MISKPLLLEVDLFFKDCMIRHCLWPHEDELRVKKKKGKRMHQLKPEIVEEHVIYIVYIFRTLIEYN